MFANLLIRILFAAHFTVVITVFSHIWVSSLNRHSDWELPRFTRTMCLSGWNWRSCPKWCVHRTKRQTQDVWLGHPHCSPSGSRTNHVILLCSPFLPLMCSQHVPPPMCSQHGLPHVLPWLPPMAHIHPHQPRTGMILLLPPPGSPPHHNSCSVLGCICFADPGNTQLRP